MRESCQRSQSSWRFASDPELFPDPAPPPYKQCAVERRLLSETGMPPKIRPIDAGTLFAKTIFLIALSIPQAKRAPREALRGWCTLRGYLQGWVIGKMILPTGSTPSTGRPCLTPTPTFSPNPLQPALRHPPSWGRRRDAHTLEHAGSQTSALYKLFNEIVLPDRGSSER